jgi:uncharacterized repeat protein (TIGR03943 family)
VRESWWSALQRRRGAALTVVALAVTLWLAVAGRLDLYIHPRYIVFTIVMVAIALVALVLAAPPGRSADGDAGDHEHDHDHDHDLHDADDDAGAAPSGWTRRRRQVTLAISTAVSGVLAITMLVVPPATLSSATATQRSLSSGAASLGSAPVAAPGGAESSTEFDVREWAGLLAQSSDASSFAAQPADVIGLVTPDPDGAEDVFYVTRFVITCCAVDAQPVGVPVYAPGWSSTIDADDWVRVTGIFSVDPSATASAPIALVPDSLTTVAEPDDPYLS